MSTERRHADAIHERELEYRRRNADITHRKAASYRASSAQALRECNAKYRRRHPDMLLEKEGVRYHRSVCQSRLSAHALCCKLHVARAIHMARNRRLNSFQEKIAVVTYHLRGELVNSSLTRAEYDVKIDCMLQRCVTI